MATAGWPGDSGIVDISSCPDVTGNRANRSSNHREFNKDAVMLKGGELWRRAMLHRDDNANLVRGS